jgi:hypothetical protein
MTHPDRDMIALGIRQPWAELILRGIKTLEIRSQPTARRGTIYLYTSKKLADIPAARLAIDRHRLDVADVPRGLLVGTVDLIGSRPCTPAYADSACVPASLLENQHAWELGNPQRLSEPLAVRFLPYGVWFYPFKRKNSEKRG